MPEVVGEDLKLYYKYEGAIQYAIFTLEWLSAGDWIVSGIVGKSRGRGGGS